MAEVTLYCKKTVVSTKPVKPGKKIPLSSLDLLMENHKIKMVYYYKTPEGLELGELTKKLSESLSEMLSYFPIVTGRLMRNDKLGKWMIKCNDAGVRLVDCRIKGSVEGWLENLDEEKEKSLIHWEDMFHIPHFWSTFYIKLTEFEEGGLAVGLSCTQLLADPFSATQFIKAWADTALCGNILVPPFFHPLPKHRLGQKNLHGQSNTYLINHYQSLLESPSPSLAHKSKTIMLEFKEEMVQACINLAQSSGPTNRPDSSLFTALVGLLWACISRVKRKANGLIDMLICLEIRNMLGLDKGFFGNFMVYNKVNGDGIRVDDIAQATRAIEKAIGKVDDEVVMDLIEWLDHHHHNRPPLSVDGGDLVFINLDTIESHNMVFVENYYPIKLSYYIEPIVGEGKVLILPSRPYEGKLSRVVTVTLPNDEVVKLCEDKLLIRFSPTILI